MIESKYLKSPQMPSESPSTVLQCWQWRVIGHWVISPTLPGSILLILRVKILPSNSILDFQWFFPMFYCRFICPASAFERTFGKTGCFFFSLISLIKISQQGAVLPPCGEVGRWHSIKAEQLSKCKRNVNQNSINFTNDDRRYRCQNVNRSSYSVLGNIGRNGSNPSSFLIGCEALPVKTAANEKRAATPVWIRRISTVGRLYRPVNLRACARTSMKSGQKASNMDFDSMKYADLQSLAKELGLKANMKVI